jgi:hypothetical protein
MTRSDLARAALAEALQMKAALARLRAPGRLDAVTDQALALAARALAVAVRRLRDQTEGDRP